jgi:hypothetical protein
VQPHTYRIVLGPRGRHATQGGRIALAGLLVALVMGCALGLLWGRVAPYVMPAEEGGARGGTPVSAAVSLPPRLVRAGAASEGGERLTPSKSLPTAISPQAPTWEGRAAHFGAGLALARR